MNENQYQHRELNQVTNILAPTMVRCDHENTINTTPEKQHNSSSNMRYILLCSSAWIAVRATQPPFVRWPHRCRPCVSDSMRCCNKHRPANKSSRGI